MPISAFILTEHMLATSVTWPLDILTAANQSAKQLCPQFEPFQTMTLGVKLGAVRCQSGIQLSPEECIDSGIKADIIFLPALWRNPQPVIRDNEQLLSWLQEQFENGTIICGVGTGCCFMAAAGLLDNKPATTHWYYFDRFHQLYPKVQLKRQHFITQAGNLYCAASINSLADLTIYFIQRFFNSEVAQHIQRHFSHEVRRAYEMISYFEDTNTNHPDEDILQVQLWLHNNIAKSISLSKMADIAGMSARNFNRRFKTSTGKTPTQYLNELRIRSAQDLLHSSNLSISEIADKVGFQDVSYFSQLFRKTLSVSPSDYRTTVRAKLFSSGSL